MQSGYVQGIDEALEFGVTRVKALLQGLTPEQLAATAPGLKNSIATLVLHTYGTEVNVAHRLRGVAVPDELKKEYLLDQGSNPLPTAVGETAESLLAKIEKARGLLRESFAALADADLDKQYVMPNGTARAYRFFLALLPQHQGQHYGHMQLVKQLIGA